MSQDVSIHSLSIEVLEARTRLARENVQRLLQQKAQGITRGPPSELEILRERERVRPHTVKYAAGPMAVSLLDLVVDNAAASAEGNTDER